MLRAALVTVGTVASFSAALVYTPRAVVSTYPSQVKTAPVVAVPTPTNAPPPAKASTAASAPPAAPAVFSGPVVDTRYGPVQVAVTVDKSRIVDVSALTAPANDVKSASISDQTIPQLREAVLSAQSAQVATISGATFTSVGFLSSLTGALAQAHL